MVYNTTPSRSVLSHLHNFFTRSGVTLKENNLREIDGGRILDSQGVLVANRRALMERPQQLLPVLHELLERLDAHLKAEQYYSGEPGTAQV
jgi:ATP phosphoribosyltransferase